MKTWADGAHYQCREVEVYTKQIENGEIPRDDLFVRRLQGLYIYAHGNENSPGCANSKWAPEFADFIERADKLFKENGVSE